MAASDGQMSFPIPECVLMVPRGRRKPRSDRGNRKGVKGRPGEGGRWHSTSRGASLLQEGEERCIEEEGR